MFEIVDTESPVPANPYLYGLTSLRRTAEEVSLNVAYRWFLGYRLQEEAPHFSTISYNFRHRFTSETVDRIFSWILIPIFQNKPQFCLTQNWGLSTLCGRPQVGPACFERGQ